MKCQVKAPGWICVEAQKVSSKDQQVFSEKRGEKINVLVINLYRDQKHEYLLFFSPFVIE